MLWQMWGRPKGEPVTLSWTVNARTLDEAEDVISAGYERGYENFNIKVAPEFTFAAAECLALAGIMVEAVTQFPG